MYLILYAILVFLAENVTSLDNQNKARIYS